MKRDFALIKPNKATGEHDVMTITIFDNPTEANMVARSVYGDTACCGVLNVECSVTSHLQRGSVSEH